MSTRISSIWTSLVILLLRQRIICENSIKIKPNLKISILKPGRRIKDINELVMFRFYCEIILRQTDLMADDDDDVVIKSKHQKLILVLF